NSIYSIPAGPRSIRRRFGSGTSFSGSRVSYLTPTHQALSQEQARKRAGCRRGLNESRVLSRGRQQGIEGDLSSSFAAELSAPSLPLDRTGRLARHVVDDAV